MSIKKEILTRLGVVYILIVVFGLLIAGKIFYLQFFEKELWVSAETQSIRHMSIESNRGNIYSSDGRMLAVSVPFYEIRMDMQSDPFTNDIFYGGLDSLSRALSGLFRDRSWAEYKQDLVRARENGNRYYLVKRNVTYDQLQQVKTFPIFRLGRFTGGVIYVQINKRNRPHGLLAARTIGNTMEANTGSVVGIEGAYETELKGIEGYRLMRRVRGDIWMPISDRNEIEPRDGYDVYSTIDLDLQDVAENALLSQLQRHDADHGTVILMEVATGKVRAIANLGRDVDGVYREIYNYGIGESAEPGSTFKLASVISLLEDGYIEPGDIVDVGDGSITYYGKRLDDSGEEGLGKITVQEAFEKSSNVGISKLVNENYKSKPEQFINRLYKMGLNQKLDLEIKGEGIPDIKYPDSKLWSGISLPMMSIGYEVRMTPLQILTFYNAIANDGVMVKPQFVEELRYHGKLVKRFDRKVIKHSVCSAETRKKVQKMLEGVVERGTAKNLNNSYYKIAGKTGTAQIANQKYGYNKRSYQASFAGYFPADNPRYSCIVVVNSPSKWVYYGNVVAGPIFREVADKIYIREFEMHKESEVPAEYAQDAPYSKSGNRQEITETLEYLDIPFSSGDPDAKWISTTSEKEKVNFRIRNVSTLLVPDVTGMGLKDAVYLLENAGLSVVVRGRGTVKSQSLSPGSNVRKGETVRLEMSITEG